MASSSFTLLLTLLLLIPAAVAFLLSVIRKKSSLRTPPGIRGWPILGETIDLLRNESEAFVFKRTKRFGKLFSAHLFGRPGIVISTPEDVKFFLTNPGARSCKPFMNSGIKIVGAESVAHVEGAKHAKFYKTIINSMTGDTLKNHVQRFDRITTDLLASWQQKKSVNVFHEMLEFSFKIVTAFICDDLRPDQAISEGFFDDVTIASRGLFKLPINLPFTDYHRALQARKRLHTYISRLISVRRTSGAEHDDLLQRFISDADTDFTQQQIEDNIVSLLFAAQHTTPLTLVWMMKRLQENPTLLKDVVDEQEHILQSKGTSYHLTWEDTRKMPVTLRVLNETLRLGSGGLLMREMKETIEYNGYVFPKGWTLNIFHTAVHLDHDNFLDPYKFDPSRFLVPMKPGTFTGFGWGLRACPGSELAKLEILIFFHRLVTQCSWEPTNPNAPMRKWPMRIPADGYVVKINNINE